MLLIHCSQCWTLKDMWFVFYGAGTAWAACGRPKSSRLHVFYHGQSGLRQICSPTISSELGFPTLPLE